MIWKEKLFYQKKWGLQSFWVRFLEEVYFNSTRTCPFFLAIFLMTLDPQIQYPGGSRVMRIKVRVAKGNHECPADRTDFNIPCWPTSAVSEG